MKYFLRGFYLVAATAKIIGGAKVIIDGLCLSACTMYLRKDWALDVCYTPSALFGFHKPYRTTPDGIWTGISAITAADTAWLSEFFNQMPHGIQAMLKGKQIPEPAAGDPPWRFILSRHATLETPSSVAAAIGPRSTS
ncbi:hypothetical protein [Mesorhizobium sp.]|uniref:hypothetical protein n=1 Tax=Mesorhizobium sp. TaxID=1871066 RepID=UPI000FE7ECFF|nr:hypothetical protein [Mesorhizobium sp.]RWE37416.1 MAG: hypothetical protein EOS77_02230 [Mesorhizobium sp.]